MWYDNLKSEWPEIIKERLVDRKTYINLGQLFAATDVSQLLMDGKIYEARKKTLTYLQNLLERGEVKVLVKMPQVATNEEVDIMRATSIKEKRNMPAGTLLYGNVYKIDWIKVFDHTNAAKAVEHIKAGWEKFETTYFEQSIEIILSENNFGEWETSDLWIDERAKGQLINPG
jgi:hypothetical protein